MERVILAGILSEPTLYKELFELIDYLKRRNLKIELNTNGDTHDEEWWRKLSGFLDEQDCVLFTICGTTQELHSKYRVGSNLSRIMAHVGSFREIGKHNDCLQYIRFQYNTEDAKTVMKRMGDLFSNVSIIDTLPYNERFNVVPGNEFDMQGKQHKLYMALKMMTLAKYGAGNNRVDCLSRNRGFLALDNYGNEYPCFLYRLYSKDTFKVGDYRKIERFDYEFCYECEEFMKKQLSNHNMEVMA